MRSPIVRVAKWAARMQDEALSPIMSRRLATAVVKYEASAIRAAAIEDAVRVTLNSYADDPVPTIQYPFYLCFGREIGRLRDGGILGTSFTNEVAIRKAVWVARGLNTDVLDLVEGAV